MHAIVVFLATFVATAAGFVGGWYCHYRFGSTLKAKVEQIATELSNFKGNKASGK